MPTRSAFTVERLDPCESDPSQKDEIMRHPPRWIRSALEAAALCRIRLPWERGLRRAAMIARRTATQAGPLSLSAMPEPALVPVPIRRAS